MSKTIRTLHYEISGSGPTVVLLHGFMASTRYWDKVIAALSKEYRVIALDLLGFGRSPKPGCSRYDYEAQLQAIDATLTQLDVTGQFTLVGHSMGALIALRYARTNQHRVSKLLLANMPLLLNKQQAKQNILGTSLLYRVALQPGMHAVIWPIFRLTTALRLLPEKMGEGASGRKYIFQSTGISRLRSMRNVIYAAKIEADLRALAMSTTVLSGLQDRRAMYLQAVTEFQLGSHVRFESITGGHHFPLTQPQLFQELLVS